MAKYCVKYLLKGVGYYFVEAPTLSLAYKKMYDQFHQDNSLIVHAEYNYGFEILGALELKRDFPKMPRYRVTTAEQRARADDGEVIDEPPMKAVEIACPELFDFDYKPDDEKK